MRYLFALAVVTFAFATPPARAQGVCCGHFGYTIVQCPTCTDYYNQGHCSPDPDGPTSAVPFSVDCSTYGGCGRINSYAPAGGCGYDALSAKQRLGSGPAGSGGRGLVFVNAYLRNCKGEFVAVRLAVLRSRV